MRPGVNIEIRETPPARTAPTDTGVWFVAGLAERGPTTTPQLLTSISEYERYFGERVSYGYLYDALDVFFREGGGMAYAIRVVGPAAVKASKMLNDITPAPTLKVDAISPGEWGNALTIEVTAGDAAGEFKLIVRDATGILESSPSLVDKPAALAWAARSKNITLTDQASTNDPAVAAASALTGGVDDRAAITDTQWANALALFSRDLGPGQVSYPGRTTAVAHGQLMEHAASHNRCALLDAPNTNDSTTLLSLVDSLRGVDSKWAAIFGPWLNAPGTLPLTTRIVPPSSAVAGLIARVDASVGNVNTPAAGENGQTVFCNGLAAAPFTDPDREELNANGYNAIILKYGGVRVYGWRSLADPEAESNWINWANSRLIMEIAAEADRIGEMFVFEQIDGSGLTIASFGGSLTGMLLTYWSEGSLYGATPEEAFVVDVGPSVNTPETISNLELRAIIMVRPSPFAEMITIELVKAQVTETFV
jgi:phage tail sheath protein FI